MNKGIGRFAAPLATLLIMGSSASAQEMLSQSDAVDIIVACKQAEHDYALYRDRNDPEGFAKVFTVNGEWGRSAGRVMKGREAIHEYIAGAAATDKENPEYHLQFNTTIQIKPTSATTAEGVSYALVLESPAPEGGGVASTTAAFQVASESRSTYEISDEGCKIATREYTTLFVDPE